jgi:hypothetical protein
MSLKNTDEGLFQRAMAAAAKREKGQNLNVPVKYRAIVHVGPLRKESAEELLGKLRSYRGNLPVSALTVGTESAYLDVKAEDEIAASILTSEYLMSVFGAATGLTQAVRFVKIQA